MTADGGNGIAVPVDRTVPDQVRDLVRGIDKEQGLLDILVNDLGSEHLMDWHKPIWEQSDKGLRRLRVGIEAHMITSHFALPLLIRRPGGLVVEVTDDTAEVDERYYRSSRDAFFDLSKVAAHRLARAHAEGLRPYGGTAVSLTPGWLRSEMMLDHFGVTEKTGATRKPGNRITGSPNAQPDLPGFA